MGIKVDEGFIYFHEMLYRVMRAQYVTKKRLKFSKMMIVKELAIQYQIMDITLKSKTKGNLIKQEKENAFLSYHDS